MIGSSNHVWGPPPPGSGKQPVCKKCGIKRSMAREDAACLGTDADVVMPTAHDYEPFK